MPLINLARPIPSFKLFMSLLVAGCCLIGASGTPLLAGQDTFPQTQPIVRQGDLADEMIKGIDRFLLDQWEQAGQARVEKWSQGLDEANSKAFTEQMRRQLEFCVGLPESDTMVHVESVSAGPQLQPLFKAEKWQASQIRWNSFGSVMAQGILLEPLDGEIVGQVIAVGDPDVPWQDFVSGEANFAQVPIRLVSRGIRVIIPQFVSRLEEARNGRASLTHREFLYRQGFILGRHLVGLEARQLINIKQWCQAQHPELPIGIVGYGEGAQASLFATALSPGWDGVWLSGYVGSKHDLWSQPIDRNIWLRWKSFGDAELFALSQAKTFVVEAGLGPQVEIKGSGAAPSLLQSPSRQAVRDESDQMIKYAKLNETIAIPNVVFPGSKDRFLGAPRAFDSFAKAVGLETVESAEFDASLADRLKQSLESSNFKLEQQQLVKAWEQYYQELLTTVHTSRDAWVKQLDTSDVDSYVKSIKQYRHQFYNEVLGRFELERLPLEARSRKIGETEDWTRYEIVIDVFPDVFAYGELLWPKGIEDDEKRPAVVCQHGLEGRPRDTIEGDHYAYHDFAAKLAERGYIVFAPQNLYLFEDRFRTLQRKANPLGTSLFSIMVPQHQQITDWLSSLPNVDSERIAFYGLSYGGKSAMRIPALVDNYCLSICSADFNDWVWKNASTQSPYSYVWTGEYEIFEFDLAHRFNYAEMAALICPRPFMVERGHFDGVAPDQTVAYEFAKVRHLYQARLNIGDRCEIEWFVGPHTINGKCTFEFLDKHLHYNSK